MPHDVKKLEQELRSISEATIEMIRIIHMPGYTTPREFAFSATLVGGIAMQMQGLLSVSREIVGGGR